MANSKDRVGDRLDRRTFVRWLAVAPFAAGLVRTLPARAAEVPKMSDDPAVQKIWQDMIVAAQAEGKISIAASGNRTFTAVYDAFSKKFGIETVISYGGGSEQATRMLAERKGGIYAVDIGHVGANTLNRRLLPAGAMAPMEPILVLPEVKDPKQWYGDRHWYADSEQKYAFVHSADFTTAFTIHTNTRLMKEAEIASLKKPEDFFNPKWKKKIVALSPMEGQAGNSYFRYGQLKGFGMEWMKQLIQGGNVDFVSDSRLIEDGLAGGKYAFTLFAIQQPLDKMERQGLPLKRVGLEFEGVDGVMTGGSTSQIVEVYDKAPHPNASKLFVNWLLSKDGQMFIYDNLNNPPDPHNSLRKDIPKAKVDPTTVPKDGVTYEAIDMLPEYLNKRDELMKQIQDWYKESHK
jgi:ABC-type Fe3+ transport system substrate-binding protein